MANKISEIELYQPIKALLEEQGYKVKSEIAKADIVACSNNVACSNEEEAESGTVNDPIIVELKTSFSLTLFHQAVERQSVSDAVYIAVPRGKGKPFQKSLKRNLTLCKRLGLGLITVRLSDKFTEIHLDPAPYTPRKNKKEQARLLKEFALRKGDPNHGGTQGKLITAYKQDALRCVKVLIESCDNDVVNTGAMKASEVAKAAGVSRARNIMADNHYGWFERVSRGVYQLTIDGKASSKEFEEQFKQL